MFLRRRNKTGKRILATALTVAMLMGSFFTDGLSAQAAEGDFLQDFESYTTDQEVAAAVGTWGTAEFKLTSAEDGAEYVCSGDHSLAVVNRVDGANVVIPGIQAFAGKKVKLSFDVKTSAGVRFAAVIQQKKSEEADMQYDWVAIIEETTGGWDHIEKEIQVEALPQNLYFQSMKLGSWGETVSDDLYLDNVKIELMEEAEEKEEDFKQDFEAYSKVEDAANDISTWGSAEFKLTSAEDGAEYVCAGEHSFGLVNRADGNANLVVNGIAPFAGKKIKIAYDVKTTPGVRFTAVVQQKDSEEADMQYSWVGIIEETTGGWDHMEAEIQVAAMPQNLYFQSMKLGSWSESVADDFYIDNITITVVGDADDKDEDDADKYVDTTDYEKLAELYKDDFILGVAVQDRAHWGDYTANAEIGNPNKEKLIKEQFNSITFGNELKPNCNFDPNSPTLFKIDNSAKTLLDFAKENNIGVRGHVLVWHSQTSSAFFAKDFAPTVGGEPTTQDSDKVTLDAECLVDEATLLARLKTYIYGAIEYTYANDYADVIYAWDVVNEAADENRPDGLRDSYYYKIIGPEFLYYSFLYAREAVDMYSKQYAADYGLDPNGDLSSIQPALFYNDYNEWFGNKSDAIINFLTKEKFNEGHTINSAVINPEGDGTIFGDGLLDGIGMQGHISDNQNINDYMTALEKYDAAVGEVHITELDVGTTGKDANAEYYQAKFYYDFFDKLVEEKEKGVNLTSVTLWGLTDDASWRQGANPLIFRADLSKKPSFDAMVMAAKGEEFTLEPAYIAADISNSLVDFEDNTLDGTGLAVRGAGKLEVQSDVVRNGEYALKVSGREANWNGVCFDVARFAGQEIEISAWVKSEEAVKLSADIQDVWPNLASVDTTDGEWHRIYAKWKVPYGMTSYVLYFENSGTTDIYLDDIEVRLIGLYENYEDGTYNGFVRASGHQPVVSVSSTANHTDKGAKAFLVTRTSQDANMKFDATSYIGKKVKVSAYVKTEDAKVRLGYDASTPVQMAEVNSSGDWTLVEGTYTIPGTATSAYFYVETDGTADMLVDDIRVALAEVSDDGDDRAFMTRWGGAGTLTIEDEAGNKVAKLDGREEPYYGIAWDMASYAGYEVEVSIDVKSAGSEIYMTAAFNDTYPRIATAKAKDGEYVNVIGRYAIDKSINAITFYIEDDSKEPIYADNLKVRIVSLEDKIADENKPVKPEIKFADVKETEWQYKFAKYAVENDLMKGKDTNDEGAIIFDPNTPMTRAEFVQVLYNKEGKPAGDYENVFTDVKDGAWYADAVLWAASKGIVKGKGDIFDVNGKITRQEMATVLCQYASKYKGYDVTSTKELEGFDDISSISDWATNNMQWAVEFGIMKGAGTNLKPLGNASRAEAATMLYNFIQAYENK